MKKILAVYALCLLVILTVALVHGEKSQDKCYEYSRSENFVRYHPMRCP